MMKKRIFAWLVACACVLTSFAGAAFTDAAQIDATEAVQMLSSLEIVGGYADGSYKPNATVTRGEMAKMIYAVCLGTSDASAYQDVSTDFTDISGHWARGYIKYCQLNNILAGRTATRFAPDETVTGSEAAKMLLVVMGYDPARAGLTGTAWEQSTLALAADAHLLDDVNCDFTAALPRQYAAQLLYNAIDGNCVTWSKDAESYDALDKDGLKRTVGEKYLGMYTSVGTLVKVQADSITIVQNDEDLSDSSSTLTTFSNVSQDYTGLLGHRIRVMNKNDKVNQVLGVYETDGSTCVTVNHADIKQNGTGIKCNDIKYDLNTDGIKIYQDGAYDKKITAGSDLVDTQSPDQIILVDSNDDGDLELALVQPYLVAPVTTVSKKSIKAGGVEYKFADDNIQSGIAKDDYVIITHNGYNDQYDIVKATKRTGTVVSVKGDADPYDIYNIDGTEYARAAENYAMNEIKGGETVEYILVNHVLFYTKSTSEVTSTAFSNVAMVLGLDTNLNGNQAKLLFMDGSTKIVTVAEGTNLGFSDLVKGNFYEIMVGSNDSYYFDPLTTSENYYSNYTAVDNGLISGWSGSKPSGGKPITKSAYKGVTLAPTASVILYAAGGNSFQIVGANQYTNLFTAEDSVIVSGGGLAAFMQTAQTDKEEDTVYLMAVAVSKMPDLENDGYGYIVSDSVLTSKTTLSYTFWDGERYHSVLEQIGDSDLEATDRLRGMVIGYTDIDSDGTISNVACYGSEGDGMYIRPLKAVSGTALTYAIQSEDKTFTMDSSTKVLYVDSGAQLADEIGQTSGTVQTAQTTGGYTYPNTMLIPKGTAGVALLVVDVRNKLDVPGLYVSVYTKKISNGKTKATISGADSVMMGDSLTVTLKDTKGATKLITLQNAVFADTGLATKTVTLEAKQEVTYTIAADGNGEVNLTLADV